MHGLRCNLRVPVRPAPLHPSWPSGSPKRLTRGRPATLNIWSLIFLGGPGARENISRQGGVSAGGGIAPIRYRSGAAVPEILLSASHFNPLSACKNAHTRRCGIFYTSDHSEKVEQAVSRLSGVCRRRGGAAKHVAESVIAVI